MKHMKMSAILALSMTLIAGTLYSDNMVHAKSTPTSSVDIDNKQSYEPSDFTNKQIIVTYKNKKETSLEAHTLSIDTSTEVENLSDNELLVTASTMKVLEEKIAKYKLDPNVLTYQPNFTYHTLSATDEPYYNKQWWANNDGSFKFNVRTYESVNSYESGFNIRSAIAGMDTDVTKAWSLFSGTRPVTIAIVDTGIDITHKDLLGAIYTNDKDLPNDGIDNDGNGYVDDVNGWNFFDSNNNVADYSVKLIENDHGTHCAGIINAQVNGYGIAGIASNTNTKILPIKVLGGSSGSGTTADIVQGIQYAEKMGADICNMSLGFDVHSMTNNNDNILKKAIMASNMFFVIASGNGDTHKGYNTDLDPIYPAAFDCDNIISVANLSCDGTLNNSSNYGQHTVDIAAPGTCIISTLSGNDYGYLSGTSMSAPMVAGGLAEVYSYFPNINIKQAAKILLASTLQLDSLKGKVSTGGALDIYRALTTELSSIIPDLDPPKISSTQTSNKNSYTKNLNISVTDDTIKNAYYLEGSYTTKDFCNGNKGTKLKLINNTAVISNIKKTTTYTIYAIDNYDNATSTQVQVIINPTKKIKLSASKKTIKVGKTYHLIAKPDQPSTLTYTSSCKSIATVSTSGIIKAKRKGTCKIYVKSTNGITATCKITIK